MTTNPHSQTDTEKKLPQQEVTVVPSEQCAIVQDLLPLYIEQIVSPASCSFVETHLQQCPLCQAQRNQLQQTLIIPAEQNVKPLQQIQKQQRRNILKTIFFTAIVCCCFLAGISFLYLIEWPCDSTNVQLESSYEEITINGKTTTYFVLDFLPDTVEVERDTSTYLKENNRTEMHCNIIQTTPVRQFLSNQQTHYYDIMLYPDWKTDPDVTNVLTLQFADRTVTYINGVLQE